ncbi:MAG: phosphatidate cytidylyltransferase [Pirellulaceae bacterium]|nr:phosphatidate cytidylyltransferase [Pirellulaceae bacterium]
MFDHLSREVLLTLGGIVAALITSNVIVWGMGRSNPQRDLTEVSLRLKTWWMIVGLFSLVLLIHQTASIAFLAFVSFLALKEFLSLIPTRRADHRVLFWAYLAIPIQYYWVYCQWFGVFIIFIPVYMFMWLPTRMVTIGETSGFLRAVGTLHWGLMTTVFSLSHAAFLLVLEPSETARVAPEWFNETAATASGAGQLLLLVLLTQFNDIAQFCWGKALGKRRVAPKVSPGKTWAGFVGGVATTIALASLLGPWLTFLDLPRAAMAGLIVGVSGFFADLSISALKRDLGVKDSGFSLPGHGGILDRVDSLTFTAPLYFHFVYYCYG